MRSSRQRVFNSAFMAQSHNETMSARDESSERRLSMVERMEEDEVKEEEEREEYEEEEDDDSEGRDSDVNGAGGREEGEEEEDDDDEDFMLSCTENIQPFRRLMRAFIVSVEWRGCLFIVSAEGICV